MCEGDRAGEEAGGRQASYKGQISVVDTLNGRVQWMDMLFEALRLEAFVKGTGSLGNPKFLCGFATGLATGQGSVSTPGMSSSCCVPLAVGKLLVSFIVCPPQTAGAAPEPTKTGAGGGAAS